MRVSVMWASVHGRHATGRNSIVNLYSGNWSAVTTCLRTAVTLPEHGTDRNMEDLLINPFEIQGS